MFVTLRSHSKINLGLAIGPLRPDGFHALATLYQMLEAHDLVRVELRSRPGIVITSNDRRVPLDARNTAWKMLERALRREDRAGLGVAVHIEKRLPVQGGMGAGSANAAAALVGLERLLARQRARGVGPAALPGAERLRIAAEVGSDVPLFLLGGTVLGLGRGEQVVPLGDLDGMEPTSQARDVEHPAAWEAVVALPEVGVSTPEAFRAWDAMQGASGLTPEQIAGRLNELSCALAAAFCERHASGVFAASEVSSGKDLAGTLLSTLVQTGTLQNDFEQVVFRQHPLFSAIKRTLLGDPARDGCVYAALSGSGSAVFGLYGSREQADTATERLNALGVRSLRTRTVDREAYWAGMVVDEDA